MRKKKITEGTKLQHIETIDAHGKPFSTKNFTSSYALIAFLRYAGCPFCNLAVHRLAMEQKLLLDSDCETVAFIQSSPEEIDRNIYKRHAVKPSFAILPDKKMDFYKKFEITPNYKNVRWMIKEVPYWVHAVRDHGFAQGKVDGSLFIAPAIFLVHLPSMKVIISDYKSNLFDHETFSPIYEKILTHTTS